MGGKQLGFTDYELTTAKKRTKREKFLAEMEGVLPWQALIDLIELHWGCSGFMDRSKGVVWSREIGPPHTPEQIIRNP